VHKPLINHDLVGICVVAFNTAPLAVGTWISARTFYLALPASDAPATSQLWTYFLGNGKVLTRSKSVLAYTVQPAPVLPLGQSASGNMLVFWHINKLATVVSREK
jgi:hypothetical protein